MCNSITDTDVPSHDEHPLYHPQPEHRRFARFVSRTNNNKGYTAFSPSRDPFFFHYMPQQRVWGHVAVFPNAVVFSEDISEEERKKILQYDVSFVFHHVAAWPAHWCVGTRDLSVLVGWEEAQAR